VHGGIEDATMLDYFYVVERLRRWGTTGERSGVVSPLLVPSFVRSAFALSPAQRVDNTLHRELVRRLIPEWADVPFFTPAARSAGPRARVRCLADAPDRDVIQNFIRDVDGFDQQALDTLWAASTAGASSAAAEAALSQALWRATFDQHLDEVNRHLPAAFRAHREQQAKATSPAPQATQGRPVGPASQAGPAPKARPARKARLARHPLVRRLAANRWWKAFRRTRLGRSWKGLTQ
jgi:hypothetical protein